MREVADVLSHWRATYAEIFPHRNPEAMRVDDADLALAVMLRRQQQATPARVRDRVATRLKPYNGESA